MTREDAIIELTLRTCQAFHYNEPKERACGGLQNCDLKCLHYQRCEYAYEAGWRKQIEAEWVKMEYSDDYKCSHCTYIHCNGEELRRNPQHFLYCGHCGAKMKLKEK